MNYLTRNAQTAEKTHATESGRIYPRLFIETIMFRTSLLSLSLCRQAVDTARTPGYPIILLKCYTFTYYWK